MNSDFLENICVRLVSNELVASNVDNAAFINQAVEILADSCSALLLSGGASDCSRYSIAASEPFLLLTAKGGLVKVASESYEEEFNGNPVNVLDDLFSSIRAEFDLAVPPFSGGAIGYMAYELKNQIERLPQNSRDDLGLPDMLLFFPARILIHDRHLKTVREIILESSSGIMETTSVISHRCCTGLSNKEISSNFKQPEYIKAIDKIRRYIHAGDVYQVNLSQRFSFPFSGNPFKLWKSMYELNPAPFCSFINALDHQILSNSMERFLFRQGRIIETRPIKGTRKRGLSKSEDAALQAELLESPKDDAELSMIVDLLRNDLGKVCLPNSVDVREHKRLEAYENVSHLVSIIDGDLKPETTHGDIIKAAFPGGSVTGCPKIRSMEIIDELEPHARHVYTGAIGYFGFHRNMNLSIAIRTAIHHHGKCHFGAGGGIVYDSVAEHEYKETLDKAQTLFKAIEWTREGDV